MKIMLIKKIRKKGKSCVRAKIKNICMYKKNINIVIKQFLMICLLLIIIIFIKYFLFFMVIFFCYKFLYKHFNRIKFNLVLKNLTKGWFKNACQVF